MKKIRIGIWGTGSIANRIMADFSRGENYVFAAACSRTLSRAEAFQKKYGAMRAVEGCDRLAHDPDIDLVYVASPHPFHFEDAKAFLEGGKHVIVEKPFTVYPNDAEALVKLAREKKLFLMEAMWTRFLPAIMDAKRKIEEGAVGNIRLITANFGYRSAFDPESRIFAKRLAGGSLMDVGVYALSFACMLLGNDATIQAVNCVKTPSFVDASVAFQLSWPSGASAQLFSAVDTATEARAVIYGETGTIEIPDFWHAAEYTLIRNGESEHFAFPKENEGHFHQFEHACELILRGKTESPVMPHTDTLRIMNMLTDIRRQAGITYPEEEKNAEA
ncbi:MAG: Gfo/Idh/MocA family oxidoreductase [Clostridia bacterium]|nr:Gfo/Idh/MocA family oxidoreductase [Clostridia bacterium]